VALAERQARTSAETTLCNDALRAEAGASHSVALRSGDSIPRDLLAPTRNEDAMSAEMSPYEKQAWEKLIAAERSRRNSLRARATDKVNGAVSTAVAFAGNTVKKVPGGAGVTDGIDAGIKTALSGAAKAIFIPAIVSVSIDRRAKRLRKRYPEIGAKSPFVTLDLQALDKGRPRQVIPLTNAATSAGASIAITGAEVSTTVSGGATAGVVALAIAGDVAVSLGLLGRSIAEVAVHYGYDPSEPEEEIFLMSVLSYSSAASLEGKTAALAGLSKLAQQMMRQATWKELEKDVVVKAIQSIFTKLGLRLTHKRLAQVVPVVGGVISAGLSYDMQNRALRDASRIYRVRYLVDKYGLSFDEWVQRATEDAEADPALSQAPDDEVIDIEAEVEAAIEADADEVERTS
jgi:hypothetical protein